MAISPQDDCFDVAFEILTPLFGWTDRFEIGSPSSWPVWMRRTYLLTLPASWLIWFAICFVLVVGAVASLLTVAPAVAIFRGLRRLFNWSRGWLKAMWVSAP